MIYLAAVTVCFGRHALVHLGTVAIAPNEIDSSQYQWFLAWWPHALLHGLNPFITHAVYVPGGYNLTWTTSMAGPALLLSPVTLIFGPTVAFNVFSLLAPALSAWAAFGLCRRIVSRFWPSLFGGLAYGFSGYMLTSTQGDPWLAFAAVPPLLIWLVLHRLEDSISARRFVVLVAAAVILQFTTAAELLATTTLFGGGALLLAGLLYPEYRRRLAALGGQLAIAYAAAAVLLSPFLISMLAPHPIPNQAVAFSQAPTDPTSFWVPGSLVARGAWQARQWARLGIPANQDSFAYLGLPLLLNVIAYVIARRHERHARLLGIAFLALVVAVMGVKLTVAGHATQIPLPWAGLRQLPLLRYALPMRMGVFPALVAAVILALWLSESRHVVRWGVGILALAVLVPSASAPVWHSNAVDPPFFATGQYRRYLSPADNVLTLPVDGPNERWQARSGFAFHIVGGYLGAFPSDYTRFAAWNALLNGRPSAGWPRALRAYLRAKGATAIVMEKGYGLYTPALFSPLGITPAQLGGVYFYRLARPGHH